MIENINWLFFDMGSTLVDEIALNRANCEPEQSIMIGDRIDNDIVPAKKLGMRTIWIKRGFGRYWNIASEEEKADYEVNNLIEIFDCI